MLVKGRSPFHPDSPVLVVNDLAGAPCPACDAPLQDGVSRCFECDTPLQVATPPAPEPAPFEPGPVNPREFVEEAIDALCDAASARKDRFGRDVSVMSTSSSWKGYFEMKGLLLGLRRLRGYLAAEGPDADGATGSDLAGFLVRFEIPSVLAEDFGAESTALLADRIRQLARWAADGFPGGLDGRPRV